MEKSFDKSKFDIRHRPRRSGKTAELIKYMKESALSDTYDRIIIVSFNKSPLKDYTKYFRDLTKFNTKISLDTWVSGSYINSFPKLGINTLVLIDEPFILHPYGQDELLKYLSESDRVTKVIGMGTRKILARREFMDCVKGMEERKGD